METPSGFAHLSVQLLQSILLHWPSVPSLWGPTWLVIWSQVVFGGGLYGCSSHLREEGDLLRLCPNFLLKGASPVSVTFRGNLWPLPGRAEKGSLEPALYQGQRQVLLHWEHQGVSGAFWSPSSLTFPLVS